MEGEGIGMRRAKDRGTIGLRTGIGVGTGLGMAIRTCGSVMLTRGQASRSLLTRSLKVFLVRVRARARDGVGLGLGVGVG